MTNKKSGIILQDKLGLNNFKFVKVIRVLETAYKLYLVIFDSRHPNTPITSGRIYRNPMPSMLFTYPFNHKPLMGPPIDIQDFNGMIENGLFFVVDLAGNLGNDSLRSKVIEKKLKEKDQKAWLNLITDKSIIFDTKNEHRNMALEYKDLNFSERTSARIWLEGMNFVQTYDYPTQKQFDLVQMFLIKYSNYRETLWQITLTKDSYTFEDIKIVNKFSEGLRESKSFIYSNSLKQLLILNEITIPDLKANAISNRNKDFLTQRRKEGESGSKLESVEWNEKEDTITLTFFVTPTFDKQVINYTGDGAAYLDNKYIVNIQFINVSKFLGDKNTYKSFSIKEQDKLVLDMLDSCDVKLWSSSPSWIFQSSFEYMDKIDASIYPLWSNEGKDIWAKRHVGTTIEGLHLDKHTYEILQIIKNNFNTISKELRETSLQEEFIDYIKPYKDQNGFMVFKNPTNSELRELKSFREEGNFRAVISRDDTKDIYISDMSCIHDYIKESADISSPCIFLVISLTKKYISTMGLGMWKEILESGIKNSWLEKNCKNFRIG